MSVCNYNQTLYDVYHHLLRLNSIKQFVNLCIVNRFLDNKNSYVCALKFVYKNQCLHIVSAKRIFSFNLIVSYAKVCFQVSRVQTINNGMSTVSKTIIKSSSSTFCAHSLGVLSSLLICLCFVNILSGVSPIFRHFKTSLQGNDVRI